MDRTRRLLAIAAVSGILFGGATACGSDGGSEGASGPSGTTTSAGPAGSDATAMPDEGGTPGEQDCAATADDSNLSGDSVVLFSADQDELEESDLTDGDVAVVSADGSSMDPAEIEVGVGEMFGIELEADGGIDAAIVGCADGQTLVPGVAAGFVITEPGTYSVVLEIAETELGTVVVS